MIKNNSKIELLSPAKDLQTAKTAILAGADAVYIGFLKFGARKQAGNSLDDIKALVEFADLYRVKVYVTLNTIYRDDELPEVIKTINQLYEIGVSAIIIQDMALLNSDLPPIPLYASTQCHNNTLEKVKFLESMGISRVILPREFSLKEIKNITENTNIEVETFIHGALCVSYSGQCYMSYSIGGRSANRGECAQPCRKKYSLVDSDGKILAKDKYLLSLKDLNLSNHIKELILAGVTSFKIEGRLKDENYVKNVTAYYRRKIDEVLNELHLEKSSVGKTYIEFEPDLNKSFNRGFTDFFINGERKNFCSLNYSKSVGEYIGTVKKVGKDYFILDKNILNNSDGICFLSVSDELCGTLVRNTDGNKIYPNSTENINVGTKIFRNYDKKFNDLLDKQQTERKIDISATLNIFSDKINILLKGEDNVFVEYTEYGDFEKSSNPLKMADTITKQIAKTGGTEFNIVNLDFNTSEFFIPVSTLNNVRRNALEKLKNEYLKSAKKSVCKRNTVYHKYPSENLDFHSNIYNSKTREFYEKCGANVSEFAAETGISLKNKDIMTTKHCIKYTLGLCRKYFKVCKTFSEPLYLVDEENKKYKLNFDCSKCIMQIVK